MLVYDEYGIIVQHDIYNLNAPGDGGDSAARMGILALFGHKSNAKKLEQLWKSCVRHPYQPQWNKVEQFSRDQYVQFIAGASMYSTFYADHINNFKGLFVNKDILMPDVMWHRALCTGKRNIVLSILGPLFLLISILWSCYVTPKHELNTIACQCRIAGKFWLRLLYKLHPDYEGNFNAYYGGWRDQQELANIINNETRRFCA